MKILLLEDELMLQSSIEEYLIHLGHVVSSFVRGDFALESLKNVPYDILILDINVPHVDGFELLEHLRHSDILTPTIFISALVEIDDITKAFSLGASDYLKKPFHLKELTMRIDKILQTAYIPHAHIRLSKNYSLDMESSTLRFKGEVHVLSSRQMQIMTLLANNRSRVVAYTLFTEYVWEDMDVEIPTIRAEVNRLKKTLKEE